MFFSIIDIHMLPITGVHHKSPMNYSQEICNYTEKGRKKIHNNQRAVESSKLKAFQMFLNEDDTIEFRNNVVSKFVAQYGKCYITGNELEPENAVGIRIKPKERNGTAIWHGFTVVWRLTKRGGTFFLSIFGSVDWIYHAGLVWL